MRFRVHAVQAIFLACFLAVWELATRVGNVDPDVLPAFSTVLRTLAELVRTDAFLSNTAVTTTRVLLAFIIGAPLAILAGFYAGERTALNARLAQPLNVLVAVPQSMLLPMFILIFGVGNVQKVVFGITHIFFVLMLTTIAAVQSVPVNLVVAARSFGATSTEIYRRIYLIAMLPLLVSGLRLAIIFDVIGILLAEMYASQSGIGFLMMRWGEDYRMKELMAAVLLISVATIAFNEIMRMWETRLSAHARTST